jgi:uncharacterized membrane protein
MSQVVVLGFNTVDDATHTLRRLRDLEKAGQISLEDTAIVSRDEAGKVHKHNEVSGATEGGAVVGGMLGLLIGGLIFPIAGLAIGALAGAGIGSLLHTGVDGKFVDDVRDKIQPGHAALFLIIREAHADSAMAAVRGMHGEVIQTSLDEDAEEQLRQALAKSE